MIDALTSFINSAGFFAPLYYILGFVFTALVPVVPTPLVAALGGSVFGLGPAMVYGVMGLALGAFVSLTLAKRVGRPLLRRIISDQMWDNWEKLLSINAVWMWGLVFFLTNIDFLVLLAGLSSAPTGKLWAVAVAARLPWLLASVWLGDVIVVNDTAMWIMLLLLIPGIFLFNKAQTHIRRWLIRFAPDTSPKEPETAEPDEAVAGVGADAAVRDAGTITQESPHITLTESVRLEPEREAPAGRGPRRRMGPQGG